MKIQESLLLNYMLPVKIHAAIPKPWQVKHDKYKKIKLASRFFFLPNFCRLCVVKLNKTLKPLNRFLYAV